VREPDGEPQKKKTASSSSPRKLPDSVEDAYARAFRHAALNLDDKPMSQAELAEAAHGRPTCWLPTRHRPDRCFGAQPLGREAQADRQISATAVDNIDVATRASSAASSRSPIRRACLTEDTAGHGTMALILAVPRRLAEGLHRC